MVQVDFISDFLTQKFIAESLGELKRFVAAKLDQPDFDWKPYTLKVDGVVQADTHVFSGERVEVRAHQGDIKGA